MSDHYEVLQVHPAAEPEVIRSAFRALARKHHPDFGGDARRMAALNEAWDILGDPGRRAAYDARRRGLPHRASQPADRRPDRQPPRGRPTGPIAAAAERRAETREAEVHSAGGPASRPASGRNGTVLDFGRYAGWTVRDLAAHDPDYLQWLARTPIGRPLRAEIDTHVPTHGATNGKNGATATATAVRTRPSRFGIRNR